MFHFVLLWYNQLNFLKLSLRKINDVLTSKEYIVQYLFLGLRLDFSFGGLIYASNFIHKKVHIFMNFDGMILLTFYMWICVVHCAHQDKCLKTLHYKFGYKT